jgi:hypothetical protein
MTHIEADAVTLPELALLVHRERIFSGKTLMDHKAAKLYNKKPKMSIRTSPSGKISTANAPPCSSTESLRLQEGRREEGRRGGGRRQGGTRGGGSRRGRRGFHRGWCKEGRMGGRMEGKRREKRGGRMHRGGRRGGERRVTRGGKRDTIATTKTIEVLLRTSLAFDPPLESWGRC